MDRPIRCLAQLVTWGCFTLSFFVPSGALMTMAHEADGHPVRIQQGSCDDLGRVAFQLTGVGATITPQGTPVATPVTVGAANTSSIQVSETTLDTSFSELTKDPYAIVVYESDDAMDHIIACGNVGGVLTAQMSGMTMPGDELAIWIAPARDSGYVGIALLEAAGKQAKLRLFLAEGLQRGASPEGEAPGGHTNDATPHAD